MKNAKFLTLLAISAGFISANGATSYNLSDLIAASPPSIFGDNVSFSNFSCHFSVTTGGLQDFTMEANLMAATKVEVFFDNLDITLPIASSTPGQVIDMHLNYQVTTSTPGAVISGGTCDMFGWDAVGSGSVIHMADVIYLDSSKVTAVGGSSFFIDENTSIFNKSKNWNYSSSLTSFYVDKDVSFTVGSDGAVAVGGSEINQRNIVVVPEPTSLSIVALLGSGWMLRRRARR